MSIKSNISNSKINWKKEGYFVGYKTSVISRSLFDDDKILDVEVIYVGTTILKVKTETDFEITFKSQVSKGIGMGYSYLLFKSRDLCLEYLEKKERKNHLTNKIPRDIKDLTLEELEFLDEILTNVKKIKNIESVSKEKIDLNLIWHSSFIKQDLFYIEEGIKKNNKDHVLEKINSIRGTLDTLEQNVKDVLLK